MSLFTDKGYTARTRFVCLQDWEAFKKGEIVTLSRDDGSRCPWFINSNGDEHCMFLPDESEVKDLEEYVEESESVDTTKLQFPCCVATSEIKDEETFKKILDLFVANGATISEGDYEWGIPDFNYYGVDKNTYTKFWDWSSTYGEKEGDVTKYTLEQLLAFLPKEEAPVTQVTTLLPIGTEVKIAETSVYYGGYPDSSNPKDTKGTIIELDEDDEFCYSVRWENGIGNGYGLNDLVLWEEIASVASQEAITERSEDNSSVGIDYSVMGTTASTEPVYKVGDKVVINTSYVFNRDFVKVGQVATIDSVSKDGDCLWLSCPDWDYGQMCTPRDVKLVEDVAGTDEATPVPLVTITQEVKYTVVIKGITFTFTQEEIDELAEELLGFTTL